MNNGLVTNVGIRQDAEDKSSRCRTSEGRGGAEVVTVPERCIGCRECVEGCPERALWFDGRIINRDRGQCSLCLNCVEICPSQAHEASDSADLEPGKEPG